MPNPYLLIGLSRTPETVRRIVAHVDTGRYDLRMDPGRFSLREAVAHLADWEPILLERMRTAILSPGAAIVAFDESELAANHGYTGTDPLEQADLFAQRREVTVRFIRERADGHWDSQIVHPERGALSLYDQANLVLGHDAYHLEHLSQYL